MSIWHGALFLFVLSTPTRAEEPASRPLCFDLSRKNVRLLAPPPSHFPPPGSELLEHGTEKITGLDWGRVAGTVKRPIDRVNALLLEPLFTRNPKHTTVTRLPLSENGSLNRYRVKITVKPIFFLTLEWEEEWTHALIEGTAEAPKSILISYQKTAGTSHIRHFCGNILIKALSPDSSGVYLVEHIDADRRDSEEVMNGLLGTLKALRP
jgi:hypothetical protein